MAEETAGIGNAAALITRARPQDFGLVQGLKMAESSALAKAKMEAAAEAKKQALSDKIRQKIVKVEKLKEPTTQQEANDLAENTYSKMMSAAESGSSEEASRAIFEYNKQIPFILQKDETLSLLNPKNNKDRVPTDRIYKAYNKGGLEAAVASEEPYIPERYRIIKPTEEGFTVDIPKRINKNKAYLGELSWVSPDNVQIYGNEDTIITKKKFTPDEIKLAAKRLVDNSPDYMSSLLHDDDEFNKYYKEGYSGGNPENLKDESKLKDAAYNYTRKKLADYNDTKVSAKENGEGLTFYFDGNGASTKRYDFTKETIPASKFMDTIKREKLNLGEADASGEVTSLTEDWLKRSGGSGNTIKSGNIIKVNLPIDVPASFNLVDLNRTNKGTRNTKPLDLIKTATGQVYLIYGDNNDNDYNRYIVPMTETMKNNLYGWYKDDRKDISKAIETLLGGKVIPHSDATKIAREKESKKPAGGANPKKKNLGNAN